MNEKYYIIFDGNSVIGTDENAWEDNSNFQNYWWFDSSDVAETWFDADVFLTREQVVDVLEFYTKLNGKNVYEFSGNPEELLDKLQTDTTNAISGLNNIGDCTNAELIEKLNIEEKQRFIDEKSNKAGYSASDVIEMLRNGESENNSKMTEDAVKRPSHYMLEDGTEVKNHIRSILGDDGFKSWAIGNAIKYVSRYKDKGKPTQDLKKAQENIKMVIDVLGEQDDLD